MFFFPDFSSLNFASFYLFRITFHMPHYLGPVEILKIQILRMLQLKQLISLQMKKL